MDFSKNKSLLVDGIPMTWDEMIQLALQRGYIGRGHVQNNNAKVQARYFLQTHGHTVELNKK